MGLPVDGRIVEYAYMNGMNMISNTAVMVMPEGLGMAETKYKHVVDIHYVLEDSNNEFIAIKTIQHETALMDEMDNFLVAKAAIEAAMWEWVRADKILLSGFDMGAQP